MVKHLNNMQFMLDEEKLQFLTWRPSGRWYNKILYPPTWVNEINFCRFRCVINDGPYMLRARCASALSYWKTKLLFAMCLVAHFLSRW